MSLKSFITLGPGGVVNRDALAFPHLVWCQSLKTLFLSLTVGQSKLECLSLASFFQVRLQSARKVSASLG